MRISVLILTHNRPKLFERCIRSVINAYQSCDVDLQIIVNNDSRDITEVYHEGIDIQYQYESNNNLSVLYKSVFDKATKEYVYFLEDDDIMMAHFFISLVQCTSDVIYFNYIPYKVKSDFFPFFEYAKQDWKSKAELLATYDDYNFQFSQICFRKTALPSGMFPTDNNIQNDFNLFKALDGSFETVYAYLFRQTTDGGDNISFVALNKDPRWLKPLNS